MRKAFGVQGAIGVAAALIVLSSCSRPEAPVSSVDPKAAAQALHDRILVLDAHADIEIPGKPSRYSDNGVSRVAPEKLRAGGVDAVVMAIAVGPGPRDAESYAADRATADEKLAAVQALAADPANNAVIAKSADEIVRAHEEGKRALILGFQNARILGADVAGIDTFYGAGVRLFALTHMGHNDFADSSRPVYNGETGAYEPDAEHGGLSALGVQAIKRINALGAVVDVSQLSKQATLAVLDLSTAPVIASHTNVQALSNVRRNISDEEIDRIGANGGVIHVAAFRGYLFDSSDKALDQAIKDARRVAGLPDAYDYPYELYWELEGEVQQTYLTTITNLLGPINVEDMLDHIDYIAKRIGADHVGIGNDFNHGGGIEGLSDASGALSVTEGLLRRGYSAADIEKIWSGNFLRVLRAAQQNAASR